MNQLSEQIDHFIMPMIANVILSRLAGNRSSDERNIAWTNMRIVCP